MNHISQFQPGKRIALLVALRPVGRKGRWLFRCQCGVEKEISAAKVATGHTKSCGCARRKWLRSSKRPGYSTPPRPAIIQGDIATIVLTQGKSAVVDAVDACLGERLWCAYKSRRRNVWYALTNGGPGRPKIWLHREVAERAKLSVDGMEVDHRDGDGLNCRRENLRAATRFQNAHNRVDARGASGVRGVRLINGLWLATITVHRRTIRLGQFASKDDAAAARAAAEKVHYGDFAPSRRQ